jgi:hypothetical protein
MDQVAIRQIAERNVRLLAARPDRGHLRCGVNYFTQCDTEFRLLRGGTYAATR